MPTEMATEFDDDNDGTIDRIEFDTDGDGTPDRIETYTYDGNGNRTRTRFDDDADGNFDRIEIDFDADGNINQSRFDDDDDGNIDRSETYTYDGNGNRTRTRFDDDADGNFDRIEIDFDADGNINQTRFDDDDDGTIDRIAFDTDDDGNIDRSETYTYDGNGNRTRTRFDDDADGNFDRIEIDFDADGNINQTRFDDDDDGTIDRIAFDTDDDGNIDRSETYTYDGNGNRTRTRFDDDADGNFDRIEIDFDADGNINQSRFDDDDDGNIDRTETYTYDGNGNRTRTRFDDDADGNFDRIEIDFDADGNINQTRFDDDDDGTIDRIAFDTDDDGNIDRSETYTYDGNGNRTRTRFDDDADGNFDRIEIDFDADGNINQSRFDDDDDGNIDRIAFDTDDDGNIDRIDHYTFAADGTGRLTRRDFDDDGDGTADRSEAYIYNGDGNRIRTRFDDDNDGNIDRIAFDPDGDGNFDRINHYTFDDDGTGRVTRRDFDLDDDSNIDRTVHLNADGRWARVERDADDDGTIDRIDHYTFDDDGTGRVTRRDFDLDDDGNIDRIAHVNADGRWERVERDVDDDGNIDRIDHYMFDADGTRSLTRTRFDDDADGLTDRTNFDDNADGTTDRIETYTYNTNGNLIRTDFDDDADGRIDRTTETGAPPISRVALSSLDGTNGFTLTGIDASDFSGFSVSSAGDVNGDGYDDLIIGARNADPNGDLSGETYIVYGGARAPGVLDLSMLDGTNGFILSGIDSGDQSGWSVSSAGDVNGDGYDDLIIGAYSADPNGDLSGETYLVYGGASAPGTDGVLDLSNLNGANGFTLTGIDANDQSGRSVSSAGDVNGDGYDDLIIGARWANPNGNIRAGETYIVYGGVSAPGRDGVLDLSDLDGTNGFTLTGIDRFDYSGRSVSSAGDVNGDGYDDLVIGAWRAAPNGDRGAGETYIIYGGASAPGTDGVLDLSRLALDGNGFILNGIDVGDRSGTSVSSAGDVNGDGYDDLIIGAWRADPNGDSSGETYIVYGGASAPGTNGVLDLSDLDGTNGFILNGIDASDESGFSVSSAGDINGDGYDDLIIGAPRAAPNGDSSAGETYIVYGGASAPGTNGVLDLSDLDGTNGFILTGIDAYDRSGFSVSSAGDVNGDGYDDLVIGAYRADPNGEVSGETYVLYGGATGTESLVPVTVQGTAAADNFTGNAGDDSFTAIATDDVVRGGAGDDRISVTALDFAAIDGGTGVDTLVLDGAGLSLDLTGAGHAGVDSVEVFDLSGTGANTLVLDAQAVFDLTEEREGGIASLDVLGDADDRVELTQSVGRPFVRIGQEAEDGVTYIVYSDGNAQVRVETGVQVQIPVTTLPVFTSPAMVSARENQSAAYMAAAADADGDMLRYSLSGTDAARFTINPDTGEVRFRAAPDFEDPDDADGDNVYDIIVTASDGTNRTDQSVAITVTDENDRVVDLSGLNGANGFILTGIDGGESSGYVSSAGDVNGDGYDDLVIGAREADPDGVSNAGETYIVYGGASAPGTGGRFNLSTLDGSNGFILAGIDRSDRSGISVSSAGDVNGDGYDDLIIGASGADPNGGNSGETYVVYGGASAPDTDGVLDLSRLALDGNGFILTGIDTGDRSGFSVSSAGDVNGDGYDDLIIGAPYANPNGDRYAGETYLVYGGASAPGTDGVLDLGALDGTNGFTLTGIDRNDFSGFSVSSAGDVNGDGYDDLVIGAREADPDGVSNAGETYIVYGGANAPGTDGVLDLSDLDGTNGFTLTGIDAGDRSGRSVSAAGDVNGDGYDDLIIGAFRASPNGDNEAGEIYIVYGGASAPGTNGALDLSDLDGSNGFTLTGIDAGDRSGRSVSAAGDVNGDGYDDLIIGAHYADPNGDIWAGETYIVYGGASAPGTDGVLDLSALDGTNGFILTGIDAGDRSGRSVSAAGDVNGDGYDDLIIGADGADGSAGETYIVYGGATGTESLVSIMAQGTAAADNFTGNAGADSFTDIATDDVVRGGAGDDRIRVTALDFAAIDGGTGVDTLVLDGAGLALDLTGPGHAGVDSVEVFDLSGTGANTLVLDALAVFDVTEEREGGVASLDVLGDADDSVDLSGSNFALTGTVTEDGVTYNVYRDGNAQVRVEDGVSVTLAATGSQSARSLTADPDRIMPDLSHADAREGIDGTGLHSPGHSLGMDVDFMDGFSESEFEWTGVVVTGLAPPDMQAPAPGPLSSDPAINPFDALTGYDLSYDLLL